MKITRIATHSLQGVYPSVELYARQLWQYLFDYYREHGGDLSNMDNMLIDYINLTRWIENKQHYAGEIFYWTFSHFMTRISICDDDIIYSEGFGIRITRGDNCFEIDLVELNN